MGNDDFQPEDSKGDEVGEESVKKAKKKKKGLNGPNPNGTTFLERFGNIGAMDYGGAETPGGVSGL